MIDAERHRIRGKFIRQSYKVCDDQCGFSRTHALHRNRRDDVVADALAAIILYRCLLVMGGLAMSHERLPRVGAAFPKNIETVSRQHEEGHNGDEEIGAQETHGRHW